MDFNLIKQRVQSLWQEFQLPLWITEFDWNGEGDVEWGDHSRHAEIVTDFYRLMFSQEVSNLSVKLNIHHLYYLSPSMELLLGE